MADAADSATESDSREGRVNNPGEPMSDAGDEISIAAELYALTLS